MHSSTPALRVPRLREAADIRSIPPLLLRCWDGSPARLRTEVRLGRHGERLVASFRCDFETLEVPPVPPGPGPTPRLWEHDVVELFVSDRPGGTPYREIEAGPQGHWLALAFQAPRVPSPSPWTLVPRVETRRGVGVFEVIIQVPLAELSCGCGVAGSAFRVGLYRISGAPPRREHQSWLPTRTERPDFHQPSTWAPLAIDA